MLPSNWQRGVRHVYRNAYQKSRPWLSLGSFLASFPYVIQCFNQCVYICFISRRKSIFMRLVIQAYALGSWENREGNHGKPRLVEPEWPPFSSLLCVHESEKSEGWRSWGTGRWLTVFRLELHCVAPVSPNLSPLQWVTGKSVNSRYPLPA